MWQHTHRTDAVVLQELLVVFEKPIGENHPESLLDEVKDFFAEEIGVFDG